MQPYLPGSGEGQTNNHFLPLLAEIPGSQVKVPVNEIMYSFFPWLTQIIQETINYDQGTNLPEQTKWLAGTLF